MPGMVQRFHRLILSALIVAIFGPTTAATAADLPPVVRSAHSGRWSAADTWEGGKVPAGRRPRPDPHRPRRRLRPQFRSSDPLRPRRRHADLRAGPGHAARRRPDPHPGRRGRQRRGLRLRRPPHGAATRQPRPALEVGSPERPIDAKHTATIRLVYFDGMDKQSCPADRLLRRPHGLPRRPDEPHLGQARRRPRRRATRTSSAPKPVEGWRPGDRVIVTSTHERRRSRRHAPRQGRLLHRGTHHPFHRRNARSTLDRPLDYDHLGTGDYRGEVANLSRNVVVESADPAGVARPHHVSPLVGRLHQLCGVSPSRQGRRPRPLQPALSTCAATPCAAAPSSAPRSGTAATAG